MAQTIEIIKNVLFLMVLWVSQDQSWASHMTAIEADVCWSLSWAGHPRWLLHSHTWSPWPLSLCCTSFTQASSPHLGYSQHGDLAVTFLNWLPSRKIEAAKPITATPRSASALTSICYWSKPSYGLLRIKGWKEIFYLLILMRVSRTHHRRVHETRNIVNIFEKYNLPQPTTSVFVLTYMPSWVRETHMAYNGPKV